jgi:hypothetical protein
MARQKNVDAAVERLCGRISEHLDAAAAAAAVFRLDRECFLEIAERAFDFVKTVHETAEKEEAERELQ